jgi:hypothetical protein
MIYKSILCPEGRGRYVLDVFDAAGLWVVSLTHHKGQTFLQDLESKAGKDKFAPEGSFAQMTYELVEQEVAKANRTILSVEKGIL